MTLYSCTPHASKDAASVADTALVGAFSQGDTLTATDLSAYTAATKGHDFFAGWTPLRVSRQVVAGTNYRFYCDADGEQTTLDVFQPLPSQGLTRVTGINGQRNAALVVVNKKTNKPVGRYEGETQKEYIASLQDKVRILKSRARLELRSAATGEGFVWLRDPGTLNIKRSPAGYGTPLGQISHTEGELPEVLPCNGFIDGHYRIMVGHTYGYLEASHMEWDALNTF